MKNVASKNNLALAQNLGNRIIIKILLNEILFCFELAAETSFYRGTTQFLISFSLSTDIEFVNF